MAQRSNDPRGILNTLLIVLVGQVGCLTLLVVLASVLAGLWLDATFHTKPAFTIAFLVIGIPVSVILMLQVARRTLARLIRQQEQKEKESP
jgi:F0F1-type ATP synthase assembly protein I